ncbi:unnamed protein product [Prorocentrum cordatum]|uniref:Uncharacterized protein n=1 Tax=Prorocentrum cordatum TaxID=2364126 RepID=A0ABN9W6U8_9DINO|nr:unnamed protein product [Polarella glacialis]
MARGRSVALPCAVVVLIMCATLHQAFAGLPGRADFSKVALRAEPVSAAVAAAAATAAAKTAAAAGAAKAAAGAAAAGGAKAAAAGAAGATGAKAAGLGAVASAGPREPALQRVPVRPDDGAEPSAAAASDS